MPEEGNIKGENMTTPERPIEGGSQETQPISFEERLANLTEGFREGEQPVLQTEVFRRAARAASLPDNQTPEELRGILQKIDGLYIDGQGSEEEWRMLRGVIGEQVVQLETQVVLPTRPEMDMQQLVDQMRGRIGVEIEREPQTDQEAVDLTRAVLTRVEEREELFDWWSIDGTEATAYLRRIKNPEIRRKMTTEINVRRLWLALKLQWDRVSGDEGTIGELIGTKQVVLKPKMLIEMSSLTETSEGVSLSVQISRAMNLYYNYLGIWAEEFGFEFEKEWAKIPEDRKRSPGGEELEQQIKGQVLGRVSPMIQGAQEKLATLGVNNEGRILVLEKDGVRASVLKKMLANLPQDLAGYRSDFRAQVEQADNDHFFSLKEIFGKCFWVDNVDDEDVTWTRFIVAGLVGSKDAEMQALELLDFTGESDELNVIWNDNAYAATDYQKLLKIEERRRREKESNNPHGPEANLGKYPERSAKGWFRRAKISGKPVRDLLREGVPFHQVNWRSLSKLTYTLDFMLPNLRSLAVFRACTTKELGSDNGMAAFREQSLESLNKAFKIAWGRKDELEQRYGKDWMGHNPWVWYVIGAISLHNPWGQKKLPNMLSSQPLSEQWPISISPESRSQGRFFSNYEENVKGNLLRTNFLTKEEMDFVERYCKQ